jgi:hypothetical protein
MSAQALGQLCRRGSFEKAVKAAGRMTFAALLNCLIAILLTPAPLAADAGLYKMSATETFLQ